MAEIEPKKNEQLKGEFGKGTITPAGITNEKGELFAQVACSESPLGIFPCGSRSMIIRLDS